MTRIPTLAWVTQIEADKAAAKAARVETLEAERTTRLATLPRAAFDGRVRARLKDSVVVVLGAHAGARGRVFWQGEKHGETRLGVKECACGGRCNHTAMWVSAHEVVLVKPHALESQVVGETTITAEERLEQIIAALAAVGAEDVAAAWSAWGRALTPAAAYTAVHTPTVKRRSRRAAKVA